MGVQGVDGGVGLARKRKLEEADMSRFPIRHAASQVLRRRKRRLRRRDLAFTHQDLALAGVSKGEARIGGESTVESLFGTGVQRERQLVAFEVSVSCGGGGCRQGQVIAVCKHRDSPLPQFPQIIRLCFSVTRGFSARAHK